MASNHDFVDFVMDQIHGAGEIKAKKMFGEYGIYADGKIFGLICDNKLFIKPTLASLPELPMQKTKSKKINLIYLLLILTLNFSCVEKKSTEKEVNKNESVRTSKTDTLKFTSGIRAIFQDSKDNYNSLFFGLADGNIFKFNGKTFEKQF